MWTVDTVAGQMHVRPGEPTTPDAGLCATPATLNDLLSDQMSLDAALADGTVVATGDLAAMRQLLNAAVQPDAS